MSVKIKVLYLEDSDSDAKLIKSKISLKEYDFEIRRVVNKADFLAELNNTDFDIVLSKYFIPGYSGLNALKDTKRQLSDTPFIFIFENLDEGIIEKVLRDGVTDVVQKKNLDRLSISLIRAINDLEEKQKRKDIEKRLKVSQDLLQKIMDTSPNIIFLFDVINQKLRFVNYKAEDLIGYSEEELFSMDENILEEIIPGINTESCNADIQKLLKADSDEVAECEFKIRTKNNEWKWLLVRGSLFEKDEEGKVHVIVGIAEDITDKKNADLLVDIEFRISQNLASAESMKFTLGQILETICSYTNWDIGELWVFDFELKEFSVYDMWCGKKELKGFIDESERLLKKKEQWFQHRILNWKKTLWSNNLQSDENFIRKNLAVEYNLNSYYGFPIYYGDKVIAVINFLSREKKNFDNSLIKMLNSISNKLAAYIQKKKAEEGLIKSEELFRLVAKASNEIIWDYNVVKQIIWFNENFYKVLGYLHEDNVDKYDIWLSKIHPEDKEEFIQKYFNVVKQKEKYWTHKFRFLKKNGEYAHMLSRGYLVYENDQLIRVVGAQNDITEQKEYEDQINNALYQAKETDRLKSEFLAQMSHEIRTPLSVILSYASILKEEFENKVDPDFKTVFSGIDSAGRRLIRTVDLILNMSVVQTGKYEPVFRKLNLKNMMKSAIQEFNSLAHAKELNINFNVEAEDFHVEGDEYTINQIFQNLIDNAIKYTEKGSVNIRIFTDEKDRTCVSVEDSGIGISKEFIPIIFTPFTQESTGYSRRFEGNGLGLALTKKYAEINNAEVKVDSEVGKGTIFSVCF